MHLVQGYEPTLDYDPTDPSQRIRQYYDPMQMTWATSVWNRVPGGTLNGLGSGWGTMPAWAQMGIVIGVSAIAGYFGWKKFGDKHVRPVLKKVPVVGGLMGARRRRR